MPRLTSPRPVLLTLNALLLTACGSAPESPSPAPPPAATRDGRFVQDIEALARDLPRLHANLFFKTTREAFDREVESLKTRVAEMSDYEVVTGLIRLAALPGDAHTAISPFNYSGYRIVFSHGVKKPKKNQVLAEAAKAERVRLEVAKAEREGRLWIEEEE